MKSSFALGRWSKILNTLFRIGLAITCLLVTATRARAQVNDEEEPDKPVAAPRYYPPPVAGPALRLPHPPARVYLDAAYATSDDLSALPYIAGKARNARFALGGAWNWGPLAFEGELAFVNVTTIDIDEILNMPRSAFIDPGDAHQTSLALGDTVVGAIWSTAVLGDTTGDGLVAGFGLRVRIPTHTTKFIIHLMDDSEAIAGLPYYFHVEPTVILAGALGPVTLVMNQGGIALVGPDGDLGGQHVVVPDMFLWDAHYAIAYTPWAAFALSAELATEVQLNHISGVDYAKLNGVRAAWVAPAAQLHLGAYEIDLIARFGLTRGQELYGVIEYAGTSSYTLRLGRTFN